LNLAELKNFYLTLEARVENLTNSLETTYGEFNQKVSFLGATFDTVFENFTCLNQASEKISGTALRIGKQLESIQNEKNRADESSEILNYFLEFNNTSKCHKVDSLILNSSFDSRMKLAGLFRKLIHLANANIEGAENVIYYF
jgi:exocyst complex component 5